MPTTVQEELAVLRKICALLDQLDEASRTRAIWWLNARYDPPVDDQRYEPADQG